MLGCPSSTMKISLLLPVAIAPLFRAEWQPLVAVGGGAALLGAGGLWWSVSRLRGLGDVPQRTMESVKEDWRWLETRLRLRPTSR